MKKHDVNLRFKLNAGPDAFEKELVELGDNFGDEYRGLVEVKLLLPFTIEGILVAVGLQSFLCRKLLFPVLVFGHHSANLLRDTV